MSRNEFLPFEHVIKNEEFHLWEHDKPLSQQQKQNQQQQQEIHDIQNKAAQQGFQEGLEQAKHEAKIYHQQLEDILTILSNPAKLIDKQVEEQIVQTIIWLCKECIGIELSINPNKIGVIISELAPYLAKITAPKTLYLNPQDLGLFKEIVEKENLSNNIDNILEDERLSRGEYRLKTESSELDGRVQTRVAMLVEQHLTED
jgi:flagellar assembly protein FliH